MREHGAVETLYPVELGRSSGHEAADGHASAVALLAILLPTAASLSCDSRPDETRREFVPEMVYSVPYDSFAPNPVTPDGKTLLAPPRGAIARGSMPLHYGPGPDEALRAGRELTNAVPPGPQVAARGEKLFKTFCVPCHGPSGQGDGPIIPLLPMPPSLTAEHARKMPDGQIFHVVWHGQGVMPPHGTQVRPRDRWILVHHLRALQAAASPATPPTAAANAPAAAPASGAPGAAPAAGATETPLPGGGVQ
jgi:mono/diheme cytochrome c family protein